MKAPDAALHDRTLATSRAIAAALLASSVLVWGAAHAVDPFASPNSLSGAAGLAGLVLPVVAYRLHRGAGERIAPEADAEARAAAFLRATVLALGLSETAALLGAVAFGLTRDPRAWLGLVMHVILTGALWPTRERLARFLEPSGAAVGGG